MKDYTPINIDSIWAKYTEEDLNSYKQYETSLLENLDVDEKKMTVHAERTHFQSLEQDHPLEGEHVITLQADSGFKDSGSRVETASFCLYLSDEQAASLTMQLLDLLKSGDKDG